MRAIPISLPSPNPAMSRTYLRDNAYLAQTVAALPSFECEGLPVRVAFCHVMRAPRGYAITPHRHGHLEVTFITEGLVHYATEEENIPVSAGHMFLMPPGIPHRWQGKAKSSVLFGFMLELRTPAEGTPLRALEDGVKRTHHNLTLNPLTARTQRLLVRAMAGGRDFWPDLAAPLMQALLTMTFRQLMTVLRAAAAPPTHATRQRALFDKARTYIDANCELAIYRDDVAAFVGIGGRQLNRIFRAQDGRSVTAYLFERRIERARALLDDGHAVKAVAYACGFKDPAYFSRFFKRYTGLSPSRDSAKEPA